MAKQKKYTYADWKHGRIDKDFKNERIEGFDYSAPRDIGWVAKELYDQGLMKGEEWRKVDSAQEETFHKSVERSVEAYLQTFKENKSNAPEPDKLLSHKKEMLEKYIDKSPDLLKDRLYSGGWSRCGIGQQKYKQVTTFEETESHERKPINLTYSIYRPKWDSHHGLKPMQPNFVMPYNPLYDLTVANGFLKRLKQLQKPTNGQSKQKGHTFPTPYDIANEFKAQAKNKDTDYSIDDYTFVMRFAKDNPNEKNVSNIIRKIHDDPDCPKKLKDKDGDGSERRWISFYDDAAGIKRT